MAKAHPDMLFLLLLLCAGAHAAPSAFPKSGNGLWFTQQGSDWSREWLPVGNGYLAGKHYPVSGVVNDTEC